MRTEQIYYFLETVKAGSFTKAAASLHLQQPSLRESITNLENELGQSLFNRTKKGVTLTEFGKRSLPYLKSMLDTYTQLLSDELPHLEQPQFVIAAQSAFDYCLPVLYSLLSRAFSNCKLTINYIEDCERIVNNIARANSDVGLISDTCDYLSANAFYQAQLNQTIDAYTFYEGHLSLVASPNHPLTRKSSVSYTDLYGQTLVFTNKNAPTLNYLQKHLDLSRCELRTVFNYKLAESYCMDQNCITFMPASFCTNSALVSVPFKEDLSTKFIFIYRKGELNSQILTCLNFLKSIFLLES